MITKKEILSLSLLLLVLGCRHQKPIQTTPPVPASNAEVVGPRLVLHPSNGVYLPGDGEVAAIQAEYPGTTINQLKLGHSIYTGACSSCHEAKNIYSYTNNEWSSIMADMAMRSRLSEEDKAAVWKYVMAIRAAKPGNSK